MTKSVGHAHTLREMAAEVGRTIVAQREQLAMHKRALDTTATSQQGHRAQVKVAIERVTSRIGILEERQKALAQGADAIDELDTAVDAEKAAG